MHARLAAPVRRRVVGVILMFDKCLYQENRIIILVRSKRLVL